MDQDTERGAETHDAGDGDGRGGSAVEDVRAQLERSGERLQRGRTLSLPGDGELPARSLIAVVLFVVVFVAVYLLSWAVFGTIGLVIGFFTGLIAGAAAVKLFADRAGGA